MTCFTQSVRKQTSWDSQDWRVGIFVCLNTLFVSGHYSTPWNHLHHHNNWSYSWTTRLSYFSPSESCPFVHPGKIKRVGLYLLKKLYQKNKFQQISRVTCFSMDHHLCHPPAISTVFPINRILHSISMRSILNIK